WPLATDFGASLLPVLPAGRRAAALAALGDLEPGLLRRTLEQYASLPSASLRDRWALKDRACAENLLEVSRLHGKVAAWTHNGHGRLSPHAFDITTIGMHLRRALGDRHVVLGTALGSGAALSLGGGGRLQDFELPSAPPGTLDHALSQLTAGEVGLNLREVEPALGDWLATAPASRWTDEATVDEWVAADPRDCYDALLFVREVTGCRRLREEAVAAA